MKKMLFSTVLSACLFMSLMTPAFAGVDASILLNQIGNELQAEFTVTEADVEDTVVISWDNEALDLDLESYDLTKDKQKMIFYYVSPGAENDDDLTVSILLKMPQASADALSVIEDDDDEPINVLFTEAGYVYYLLEEGLTVETDASPRTRAFEIAFKDVSAVDLPFEASLIAIKEVKTPPDFIDYNFNQVENVIEWLALYVDDTDDGWMENITGVFYSRDNGSTYTKMEPGQLTIDLIERSFTFTGDAVPDTLNNEYSLTYKFQSTGYDDVILPFGLN